MTLALIYPFYYEISQLYTTGFKEYFRDSWNYNDQAFIWIGALNIIFKFNIKDQADIRQITTMCLVLLLCLIRILFFLRIFNRLSYLVTLIQSVIKDLLYFMIFFCIIVGIFSLTIGVLGYHNKTVNKELWEKARATSVPGEEYDQIGLFWGNIITIIRWSVGDNDFSGVSLLKKENQVLFWICWVIVLYIMCIIFLNFIIAEASASYERVGINLDNLVRYQTAVLIKESELMLYYRNVNKGNFPKYLIVREVENWQLFYNKVIIIFLNLRLILVLKIKYAFFKLFK